MRIGLLPLDERPVNTRYPAMIAAVAGVEVVLPPPEMLSRARQPASSDGLAHWLHEQAAGLDALIVSMEMLGYGGLIASRTTDEPAATITNRLETLRQVRRVYHHLSILGFNVITRISNSNYNFEEALYWETDGQRIYRYSQLVDRQLQGQEVLAELKALRAEIPAAYLQDFMIRRLRNHTVNLNVLQLLAANVFDLLVISSDDTSEYGLGTREKRWIGEWVNRVLPDNERLLMYPGADEVGAALLARLIAGKNHPRFAVRYAIPADAERTAPFEDGPVRITVERQIRAVGGVLVSDTDDADLIVAVNPPSPIQRDFDTEQAGVELRQRQPYLQTFVEQIRQWMTADRQVIVADVAYPNGSDPVLVDLLRAQVDLTQLAAYGGWNTAGNTIGVALAQGIAALRVRTPAQAEAQQRFLLHRFIEDWGYQHLVRAELRQWLFAQQGNHEISPANFADSQVFIEQGLQRCLDQLPGFARRWRIVPGSVRLPWTRTFEVDFDLEHVGG